MGIISKSRFGTITVPVPNGITLDDITIAFDSTVAKADLELATDMYVASIEDSKLSIKPNKVWLEGISISVTIGGLPYKDSFIIPSSSSVYDPEQYLYSEGAYSDVTDDQLLSKGLATEVELDLLSTMGPKLTSLWDKASSILCSKFVYDNTTPNLKVCRLVAFRRMQQIALSLGLESLVESILFSPGPEREWFRTAYILAAKQDYKVLESINELHRDIASLTNAMTLADLNTQVIESIDYELDTNSDYYTLAKYLVTLFCGIRYTHDNIKFSY